MEGLLPCREAFASAPPVEQRRADWSGGAFGFGVEGPAMAGEAGAPLPSCAAAGCAARPGLVPQL